MRISLSTAAIFCSAVGCGRPIPRKDILVVDERFWGEKGSWSDSKGSEMDAGEVDRDLDSRRAAALMMMSGQNFPLSAYRCLRDEVDQALSIADGLPCTYLYMRSCRVN